MKLYPIDEVPLSGSLQVYKQSLWNGVVGLLVVLLIAGALVWAILAGGAPAFLWIFVGLMGLVLLLVISMIRSALGPDNWVIKSDGSSLALKFRSYLNRHFPREDRVVAVLSLGQIESMRKVTETNLVPESKQGTRRETRVSLELKLKSPEDAALLDAAIREEIRRKAPQTGKGRIKHHHAPLRVVDGNAVRIAWRTPNDTISPGLASALRYLGASIRHESDHADGLRDFRDMSPEELREYVRELAESGRHMKAVKIVRLTDGLGLRESREYVDRLIAEGAESSAQSESPQP